MRFQFTDEQGRFRQEVRDFLAEETPPDWRTAEFVPSSEIDSEEDWAFCPWCAQGLKRAIAKAVVQGNLKLMRAKSEKAQRERGRDAR